jgi:polyisoprenoid-binding protein YceI
METLVKTKWSIDPLHSEIAFKVKHLVISTVSGKFTSFDAWMEMENDDLSTADIRFSADVNSIETGQADRDAHLKSDDFFNAEKFPELTFKSTEIRKNKDQLYSVNGDLTIRDITRSVQLEVEHGGTIQDAYGRTVAGYEITGKISRREFDLKWNNLTEAGSVIVGDEIKFQIHVEMVKEG